MTLVRWRPLNDLTEFQGEMNRLFDDLWQRSGRGAEGIQWVPAMDVVENQNEFKLVVELPGMSRGDVKISFTDNVVSIRGEKKAETREEKESWHQIERSYGSFERGIRLPAPIQADRIKARFEDGVLTVLLPKADEAKSREIQIES